MQKWRLLFFLCSFLSVSSLYASPIGYWKSIDDVTGQAKSIIQISADADGRLSGRVVKLFQNPDRICTECDGENKNKPVLGLIIMDGLNRDTNKPTLWTNGTILDPKNGKIYHCNLQVSKDDQKLIVRGYIGLPLLGRTQTWIRVKNIQSS